MESAKLSQNKESYFPLYCDSVDDFLFNYDHHGNNISDHLNQKPLPLHIETPRTKTHARTIVNIYNKIYEGTYPYKEMLDPNFVYNSFKNQTFYWKIFRFKTNSSKKGKIAGCFTIVIDYENRTGYMRGLNILPEYQGKVAVRQLSYAMIYQFFEKYADKVDKWYNESRTAHSKVQHLSRVIGAHPYAIFEGKDYFLRKKESDVLMVAHFKKALSKNRTPPKFIHPKIYNLYKQIAHFHEFEENPILVSEINAKIDLMKVSKFLREIKIDLHTDSFGYLKISFTHSKSGDYLSGLHTLSVKNIEKINYSVSSLENFGAFIFLLKRYIQQEDVEYVEMQLKADEIEKAEWLFNQEFHLCGYVPSWIKSEEKKSDKFEDATIFSWQNKSLSQSRPKLIEEAQILWNTLINVNTMPNKHKFNKKMTQIQNQLPEILTNQVSH